MKKLIIILTILLCTTAAVADVTKINKGETNYYYNSGKLIATEKCDKDDTLIVSGNIPDGPVYESLEGEYTVKYIYTGNMKNGPAFVTTATGKIVAFMFYNYNIMTTSNILK